MKQLLDFPRAQRLKAYKTAGDTLIFQNGGYSCIELEDALGFDADVNAQFWCGLFEHPDTADWCAACAVVESFDERLPQTLEMPWSVSSQLIGRAIKRDALQTRLMMLAWAHAVDEAGDMEDILS